MIEKQQKKMFEIFKDRKIKLGLVLLAFLLGILLRLWQYPFYPFAGHAEEYVFVWSGLSLIEGGVPISWSDLPVYDKKYVYWEGVAPNPVGGGGLGVKLLSPWLDEPPLFSLIVGSVVKLYNLPNFTLVSPYVIRLPSLLFSFLTLIFVFLLAKKLFGYWVGLLSLLVFGTIPTVVFGSRLTVPENLISLFMISGLWLVLGYLEKGNPWRRNTTFLIAVMAGLAKPTGILLIPFFVFWLWKDKRWKEGIICGFSSFFLFLITYFLYGFHFNKELFLKVFSYQAQRPAGWSSLSYLLINPGFSVEVFLDGFLVLGIFALAFLMFKNRTKEEEIILLSFLFSLLVVIISGGKHDQLTWYRYPIYPFMAVSIALLLKEIYNRSNFFYMMIFVPLLLSNIDLLENPFLKVKFFLEPHFYKFSFLLLLCPALFYLLTKKDFLLKIMKILMILIFLMGIMINIWVIKSRFNLLCDHTMCPLPQKIDLLQPLIKK